jgi:serine/threonine protein kinase
MYMQSQILNGRYQLETLLGQGGMATVYRGRDLRLGRLVAIKVLHGHYASDDEFLQRFTHEAMSAATLSAHPHIVDVYDVGEDGDSYYIVMELIEGNDLKAIIEQEAPLDAERAIQIAVQVAAGLEYAHRRGLVHRDIKPQNILLSPDGQVHIADFGIAKSHLSTAVTRTGIAFGTADYISPEQAQGLDATPQSDIYSLGIVLYEMLTGQLPFTGTSPMAVALQHIQQPPRPPRQLNAAIPPALEALVLRAIAKDSHQRPASASAFAQELRNLQSGHVQQTIMAPMSRQQPASGGRTAQSRADQPEQRAAVAHPAPLRRQVQRTQHAPPPPRRAAPRRARSGFSFGTFLLTMLLLGGILTLAYLTLGTTWQDWVPSRLGDNIVPTQTITPQPADASAPMVTVPRLVGLPEEEAVRLLNQLGLQRRADPNDPSLQPQYNEMPSGTVIWQLPEPGVPVPRGAEITIIISLGPQS